MTQIRDGSSKSTYPTMILETGVSMNKPTAISSSYMILSVISSLILFLASCSSTSAPPEEINLIRNKAADFTKFGNQYYEQAQFDQAISFFQLALQNNILIDNQAGVASSFNSLGKTFMAQGLDSQAEQSFLEAQDIGTQLKSPELLLQATNNLAEIKIRRGTVDQAIQELKSAVLGKESLQTKEMAVLYHSLGAAFRKKASGNTPGETVPESKNNYTLALGYFDQAAAINLKLKLYQELASNYYMTASVQSRLGELEKALSTARLALENDRKMENSLGIAQDLRILGEISAQAGKTREAFEFHFRAYRIFQALQIPKQEARSLDLMIPLLETLGMESDAQSFRSKRLEIKTEPVSP